MNKTPQLWKARANVEGSIVVMLQPDEMPKTLEGLTFLAEPEEGRGRYGGRTWFYCVEIALQFLAYKYQMKRI